MPEDGLETAKRALKDVVNRLPENDALLTMDQRNLIDTHQALYKIVESLQQLEHDVAWLKANLK